MEHCLMSITINGSGTITGLTATGISAQPVFPGNILQVVQTVKTDTFSSASTSFTNVTGLAVSITPSSTSSKILVFLDLTLSATHATSAVAIQYRLTGGNSGDYVGDAAGSRIRAIAGLRVTGSNAADFNFGASALKATGIYLDAPGTTSSTTYQAQIRVNSATGFVNRSSDDGDDGTYARGASSITVMEVAA
jgi:hypothetical protein